MKQQPPRQNSAAHDRELQDTECKWSAIQNVVDALGPDERSVFGFARELKAWRWTGPNPVTGNAVADYIERTWAKVCDARGVSPDDVWEILAFFDGSGDPRAAFVAAWDRVRLPAGRNLWDTAAENAQKLPFFPKARHSKKYGAFISFAAHLQVLVGDDAIGLPVERLASMLGVTPMMISRYRQWAVEAGILRVVSEYSRVEHRSTQVRALQVCYKAQPRPTEGRSLSPR